MFDNVSETHWALPILFLFGAAAALVAAALAFLALMNRLLELAHGAAL